MSVSSTSRHFPLIWPRSALDRVGIVPTLAVADTDSRTWNLVFLAFALPWFIYTSLYFYLQPRGLTVAPSLFMLLTGRPDPMCGLARTFAWMWRGDLTHAVLAYPLGPIVFAFTLLGAGYALVALPLGRTIRIEVAPRTKRLLVVAVVVAILANWLSKLLWLGM